MPRQSVHVSPAQQTVLQPLLTVLTGRNPFEGYVPSVPHGEKLDFGSDRCNELEDKGAFACVVLHCTAALPQ